MLSSSAPSVEVLLLFLFLLRLRLNALPLLLSVIIPWCFLGVFFIFFFVFFQFFIWIFQYPPLLLRFAVLPCAFLARLFLVGVFLSYARAFFFPSIFKVLVNVCILEFCCRCL